MVLEVAIKQVALSWVVWSYLTVVEADKCGVFHHTPDLCLADDGKSLDVRR